MDVESLAIERHFFRFQVLPDRSQAGRTNDSVFADESSPALIKHFVSDASVHVGAVTEFVPPMTVPGIFAVGIDASGGTARPIGPGRIVKMANLGKQLMINPDPADILGFVWIAAPPIGHPPGALIVGIPKRQRRVRAQTPHNSLGFVANQPEKLRVRVRILKAGKRE